MFCCTVNLIYASVPLILIFLGLNCFSLYLQLCLIVISNNGYSGAIALWRSALRAHLYNAIFRFEGLKLRIFCFSRYAINNTSQHTLAVSSLGIKFAQAPKKSWLRLWFWGSSLSLFFAAAVLFILRFLRNLRFLIHCLAICCSFFACFFLRD